MNRSHTSVALFLVISIPALARGDVVLYASQAAFDAATRSSVAVTFEEAEWDPLVGVEFVGSVASGGITFVPIASPPILPPNLFVAPTTQTNFCCPLASRTLTSSGGENIDLVFDVPTHAVGFTCYANGGEPIVFTLSFASAAPMQFTSPQPGNSVGFIGFVSSEPFTKLNWTSDFGDQINTGIDDVRLGTGACPSDLNGDGVVDAADLAVLLGAWGTGGADLDGSGTVDAADLAVLLGAWGPCGG